MSNYFSKLLFQLVPRPLEYKYAYCFTFLRGKIANLRDIKLYFPVKTLLLSLLLESSFRFTEKLRRTLSDFPYTPHPRIASAPPIINLPHQKGTFTTIGEPTLTHQSPKVHSLCYGSLSVLQFWGVWTNL